MEAIGIIILGIVLLMFFGIAGWIVKIIGSIFEFLLSGLDGCMGCLIYLFLFAAVVYVVCECM